MAPLPVGNGATACVRNRCAPNEPETLPSSVAAPERRARRDAAAPAREDPMARYTHEHAREARNAVYRARHARRREQIIALKREERWALKRRIVDYLGGACARCRITPEQLGHVAAFDCHHVDPATKRFNLCGNHSRSWESIRAELDKCQLLCACCHRVIEALMEDSATRRGRPPLDRPSSVECLAGMSPAAVAARAALAAARSEV